MLRVFASEACLRPSFCVALCDRRDSETQFRIQRASYGRRVRFGRSGLRACEEPRRTDTNPDWTSLQRPRDEKLRDRPPDGDFETVALSEYRHWSQINCGSVGNAAGPPRSSRPLPETLDGFVHSDSNRCDRHAECAAHVGVSSQRHAFDVAG